MAISRATAHKHIERKLIIQVRMFALVSLVLFGIVIYDMAISQIGFWLAVLGVAVGLLVGVLAGRMLAITWHEDDAKVIARLDKTGIWVIAVYILFAISRRYIAGIWIHGPALLAFTFATVSGIMAGRLIFMSLHIRKVLSQQGIS